MSTFFEPRYIKFERRINRATNKLFQIVKQRLETNIYTETAWVLPQVLRVGGEYGLKKRHMKKLEDNLFHLLMLSKLFSLAYHRRTETYYMKSRIYDDNVYEPAHRKGFGK